MTLRFIGCRARGDGRIDPGVLPPRGFVAALVHRAMVSST
jgi:hypothetical protein